MGDVANNTYVSIARRHIALQIVILQWEISNFSNVYKSRVVPLKYQDGGPTSGYSQTGASTVEKMDYIVMN